MLATLARLLALLSGLVLTAATLLLPTLAGLLLLLLATLTLAALAGLVLLLVSHLVSSIPGRSPIELTRCHALLFPTIFWVAFPAEGANKTEHDTRRYLRNVGDQFSQVHDDTFCSFEWHKMFQPVIDLKVTPIAARPTINVLPSGNAGRQRLPARWSSGAACRLTPAPNAPSKAAPVMQAAPRAAVKKEDECLKRNARLNQVPDDLKRLILKYAMCDGAAMPRPQDVYPTGNPLERSPACSYPGHASCFCHLSSWLASLPRWVLANEEDDGNGRGLRFCRSYCRGCKPQTSEFDQAYALCERLEYALNNEP